MESETRCILQQVTLSADYKQVVESKVAKRKPGQPRPALLTGTDQRQDIKHRTRGAGRTEEKTKRQKLQILTLLSVKGAIINFYFT